MPYKPLSPCPYPACPAFAVAGDRYCAAHKITVGKAERDRRGTTTQQGYGVIWQRLRRMILRRQPICAVPGCGHAATDVDHIIAKSRGGTDDMGNLQGLCHEHHSVKTAREDGGFGRYRPH